MKNLSKQLLKEAVSLGLCTPFTNSWIDRGIIGFIDFYKRNPDWCLEVKYPSDHILAENFNNEITRSKGVYYNQNHIDITCINNSTTAAIYILIKCDGILRVKGNDVVRCYISRESNVAFEIQDDAILYIDVYDDSKIKINKKDNSKYKIFYGNSKCTNKNR
ncbi:MAG: hypothetical protein RR513_09330 [Muribaculaceae bacterium]